MDKLVIRETKRYKIGYLSITILLSALVVYLYTMSNIKEVEIKIIGTVKSFVFPEIFNFEK